MTTNEKWIYVLNSDSLGKIRLEDTPSGWDIQQVSISRSMKYLGLFQSYKETLRFFGDGREYIQKVYERNGSEHEITIDIYEYVGKPTDKFELFFSGVIDLSTYKNEEDKFVEVDINDSSFSTKIVSRDDIRIDLSAIESIDGETIPAADEVTVNLHQRELLETGSFNLNEATPTVPSIFSEIDGVSYDGLTLPITLFSNDSTVTNLSSQDSAILGNAGSAFYDPLGQSANVSLKGSVEGSLENITIIDPEIQVKFKFWIYEDSTLAVISSEEDIPGASYTIPGGPGGNVDVSFDFDLTVDNITADNVISLVVVSDDNTYKIFQATFTKTDLTAAFNQQWKDNSEASGLLMFEVVRQLTRIITGKDKFVSEFLGLPDLGYENYGEGSLVSMHSTGQIRKLPNAKSSITLTDYFSSQSAMWNLAMGVEYDNVSQPYLRIEKLDHFFNGNVITSIHSVTKMTKSFAREWVYSDLKVGYDKAATELTNGLEEYNNKFTWSTFIKSVKNAGDFISKIRADGYGIEKLRRLSFETNPTEDTREDNDNFAVVVSEDGPDSEGNTKYKSVKDEEYDTVENIFSPESAYNLDLSPGRNLRRNGTKIRAGLEKYLDKEVKFQHAEQKANMVTKRSDEDETIDENANIDVSTLDEPLWIPDIYTCEFVLDRDLYKSILKNPGGIMKLSTGTLEDTTNYNYGWIINIEYNPETDKSTGEFLRVNLNNTSIILVDPDGNSPDPIPPIPEPTIFGALESTLPMILAGPDPEQGTDSSYNHSGIEQVTIPGIPTLERTQTFYYKGVFTNISAASVGSFKLWSNTDTTLKGLNIFVPNPGAGSDNKLGINFKTSTFNSVQVFTTNAILTPESGSHEIEVWYDGTSLASGITIHIDGANEPFDIIDDDLNGTTAYNSGAAIGKVLSGSVSEGSGIVSSCEFWIDGTLKFNTQCDDNGDLTSVNLDGDSGNGTIDLDTTPREDFFITI